MYNPRCFWPFGGHPRQRTVDKYMAAKWSACSHAECRSWEDTPDLTEAQESSKVILNGVEDLVECLKNGHKIMDSAVIFNEETNTLEVRVALSPETQLVNITLGK